MILQNAVQSRNIQNFSAINNPTIAKTLLRSMHQLLEQGDQLLMRGLPMLAFDPVERDIDCPILGAAFAYWRASRHGSEPPSVRHIDPQRLRPALGWFVLVDLVDDGDDFVYRLFGSEIAWRFDMDLTGRRVSEAPPPLGPFLVAAYRSCVAARGPLLVQGACGHPGAGSVRALLLPWTDDAGAVIRVMAVASLREQRAPGGPPQAPALVRFRSC